MASFHVQGEGGKQAEKLRADSMSAHNENPKSGSINLNTFINMVTYKGKMESDLLNVAESFSCIAFRPSEVHLLKDAENF